MGGLNIVKFSRRAVILSGVILSMTLSSQIVLADPASDSELIAQLDEVSRKVGQQNERIKTVEEEIAQKANLQKELVEKVQAAKEAAQQRQEIANKQQEELNQIARSKYRLAISDPISIVLSAQNPQVALDRTSYLGSLKRFSELKIKQTRKSQAEVNSAFAAVKTAEVEAKMKQAILEKERDDLEKERAEMKKEWDGLKAKIDLLSENTRQAWVTKNLPSEFSLEGLSGDNPLGLAAVKAAYTKIGAPYSWGAIGPDAFDCSGLIYWAYAQNGRIMPRTSYALMAQGRAVSREELQPGDIVGYYAGASHVGMYVGGGMIIHASDYGIPVQVVPLDHAPVYGFRRY